MSVEMTSEPRRILGGDCLPLYLFLLACLCGCADEDLTPETDEARKRSLAEGVSIAKAAARYRIEWASDSA